jgi:transcriptional regulator with PAS, ATPase and Fis domain
MRAAVSTLEKVLDYDANLLLLGESGVGKDHVARTVHRLSNRATGPFVTIDCAGIPAGLFESELFGYEKGAFTDAREARPGKLEAAAGGVLYLDEVAAMDLAQQAKLLRVLDEKSFTRIGGRTPASLDVRIISSTNADLDDAVERGTFRPDLFYRLNVVSVELPPLRERREDILAVARSMLRDSARRHRKSISGIERQAEQVLRGYAWPGNLRELAAVIDRAVMVEPAEEISARSLPRETFGSGRELAAIGVRESWSLEQLEKHYIRAVIDECDGNYSRAARILGISRKALLEKRKRFGFHLPESSRTTGNDGTGN